MAEKDENETVIKNGVDWTTTASHENVHIHCKGRTSIFRGGRVGQFSGRSSYHLTNSVTRQKYQCCTFITWWPLCSLHFLSFILQLSHLCQYCRIVASFTEVLILQHAVSKRKEQNTSQAETKHATQQGTELLYLNF